MISTRAAFGLLLILILFCAYLKFLLWKKFVKFRTIQNSSQKNTRKLGNSMIYLLRLLADIAIIRKDESAESAFREEIDQ